MTDTTTSNKTTPDGRSYYETLTPDALRYNGLAKCFYVDDLYTMDIDQAKALQRRLKELIVTAEVDPDECSDHPRNGYLFQGRRQLRLDEVRVLDNGNIAIGSAYEITPSEGGAVIAAMRDCLLGKRLDAFPHKIQEQLRDLYYALGTMFACRLGSKSDTEDYGEYLLRHINPLIHALEGNALAFLPTEVQPALLELRALLTDGDASAEEGSADQDEDILAQWQLTITARLSGIAYKGRATIEIAPKNRDHKSAVCMGIMVQTICNALNSKSQSMADLIGGYRHEGCDDPNCPICSKYNRD